MPLARITSRQNPIVARYRAAARGDAAEILLDGAHLVVEALDAGIHLRHAAIAADALERDDLRAVVGRLRDARVDVVTATAPVMALMSPVRSPSAIVALADRPAIDPRRLYRAPALVGVAIDVQDPGNMGAIVRVAEAAGASGVIAAGVSANPFGWKALRGAMGSALRFPVIATRDSLEAVNDARTQGCRILATTPRGGQSLFDVDLTPPTAVLIGGEGAGLPDALDALADDRVTIPMQLPVESLNAAVTTALIFYEARRQRVRKVR